MPTRDRSAAEARRAVLRVDDRLQRQYEALDKHRAGAERKLILMVTRGTEDMATEAQQEFDAVIDQVMEIEATRAEMVRQELHTARPAQFIVQARGTNAADWIRWAEEF